MKSIPENALNSNQIKASIEIDGIDYQTIGYALKMISIPIRGMHRDVLHVVVNDDCRSIGEWSKHYGLNHHTLRARVMAGCAVDKLFFPSRPYKAAPPVAAAVEVIDRAPSLCELLARVFAPCGRGGV